MVFILQLDKIWASSIEEDPENWVVHTLIKIIE